MIRPIGDAADAAVENQDIASMTMGLKDPGKGHLHCIRLPHAQLLHVNDVAAVAVDAEGAVGRLCMLCPQLCERPVLQVAWSHQM